jgi:hypothetical protein
LELLFSLLWESDVPHCKRVQVKLSNVVSSFCKERGCEAEHQGSKDLKETFLVLQLILAVS